MTDNNIGSHSVLARTIACGIAVIFISAAFSAPSAQAFDAVFELSSLDGSNGFVLSGIDASDQSGRSVSSAGDINGDGLADLVIGAPGGDPNSVNQAGESYVVFGGSSVGASGTIALSSLNGSNGFVLNGVAAGDESGLSVSGAGDINGDGVADLIIGAPSAQSSAGQSYVVFGGGSVGVSGALELNSLNGSNGFVLSGIDGADNSGNSVSGAGDLNGDGIADLIIGATLAAPNGRMAAGESYVVFGGSGVGAGGTIDLSDLNGSNGFVLNGVDVVDRSGFSVSGAGDINGDGVSDLIIGAVLADPDGRSAAGESYVVFGGSGLGASGAIELGNLNGSNGFVLNGGANNDRSGWSVSGAGDINGDGVSDLIIGAVLADPDGLSSAGESYVVFGGSGVGASGTVELSSLDGSNGFVLNGVTDNDRSGWSVSGAGDLNGDGASDLVIGAYRGDPNGQSNAGESYVVFGGSAVGASGTVALSLLDGSNGFVLNGIRAGDESGYSVSSAGDFNGDGVSDLLIGATRGDPNGLADAGETYVVFGQRAAQAVPLPSSALLLLVGAFLLRSATKRPGRLPLSCSHA